MIGTYDSALRRSVTPRLVVTRENTHVAASDEFLVIETENRIIGIEEIGMENDLDTIRLAVEQLHTTDLV
jgi:hypothetical protein